MGETSWQSKLEKKEATEAMTVLSASPEEEGRPRPELTSDVLNIPLDNNYPEHSVRISKDLDPLARDTIFRLLV